MKTQGIWHVRSLFLKAFFLRFRAFSLSSSVTVLGALEVLVLRSMYDLDDASDDSIGDRTPIAVNAYEMLFELRSDVESTVEGISRL